jgi:hypothetical protein
MMDIPKITCVGADLGFETWFISYQAPGFRGGERDRSDVGGRGLAGAGAAVPAQRNRAAVTARIAGRP